MSATNIKRSWVEEMGDPQDCKAIKVSKKSNSRENSNSRKIANSNKKESDGDKPRQAKNTPKTESDPLVLQRRQKQIDYGKNTVGYHNYISQVPLDQRAGNHPKTPDKFVKYSRRSWDSLIKIWRIKLHEYDTEHVSDKDLEEIEVVEDDDDVSDEIEDE